MLRRTERIQAQTQGLWKKSLTVYLENQCAEYVQGEGQRVQGSGGVCRISTHSLLFCHSCLSTLHADKQALQEGSGTGPGNLRTRRNRSGTLASEAREQTLGSIRGHELQ